MVWTTSAIFGITVARWVEPSIAHGGGYDDRGTKDLSDRPDGRAVGAPRTVAPAGGRRGPTPGYRPAGRAQRHLLPAPRRRLLADVAQGLSPVPDRLRVLPEL